MGLVINIQYTNFKEKKYTRQTDEINCQYVDETSKYFIIHSLTMTFKRGI